MEQESLGAYVIGMLDEAISRADIETNLLSKGYEPQFVKELIAESVKLRNNKRRAQGLALILGGAVVCFLSFLLTITNSFSSTSFPYILFGVTSIGIVLVFFGLMKVF